MLPAEGNDGLKSLPVEKFILNVGDRTSTPGGGSVAATVAGLVSDFKLVPRCFQGSTRFS